MKSHAMNASKRNLLALALAATMLSSPVPAQEIGKGPPDIPQTTPPADIPAVNPPVPNSPERTMRDVSPPATDPAAQVDTTTPAPLPPKSQGEEHARVHSSVVQRDVWTRMDIDGDGRISSTEGAADTDFNTGFATMDADHDGFVSDIEYRTAAKAEMEKGRGASDASERSATGSGDALRRLDANADGSISRSEGEADAAFKANFAAIDSDSDGTVTRAEYQAWLKANRR